MVRAALLDASRCLGYEAEPTVASRAQADQPKKTGGKLRARLDNSAKAQFAKETKKDETLLGSTVLKYTYKKTLLRTAEGETKWVPTDTVPKEVFQSSACVIL